MMMFCRLHSGLSARPMFNIRFSVIDGLNCVVDTQLRSCIVSLNYSMMFQYARACVVIKL